MMNQFRRTLPRRIAMPVAIGAAMLAPLACASRSAEIESGGDVVATPSRTMSQIVASWPTKPREAAGKVSAKLGQPDVLSDDMMVWYNKGPYSRIVLLRDEVPHNFPVPHTDFLSHTVKHNVPGDKLDELYAFDGSLWVHRTRGEMTAQCDLEAHNNIALNLGHEVAMGRRTVEDARAMYLRLAMEHKQGMTSPYTSGIMFQTMPNAADPDTAMKKPGM